MQIQVKLAALWLLTSTQASAWILANPPTATKDHNSTVAPCGGLAPADISVFTDWPDLGLDLSITNFSDPSNAGFYFRVALLEDGVDPVFGDPIFSWGSPQPGADFLCYPRIHGRTDEEWLNKKAVLQVMETLGGPNYRYQCAGISVYVTAREYENVAEMKGIRQAHVVNPLGGFTGRNVSMGFDGAIAN
ncbi:hypothetical protein F5Y18DRAFT_428339 [Xylariaceae sp. FL1019]|nr:hypothetical protein F5Y18DRAFT_428339 [Xylariaceae sp. FL1019]